MGRAGRRESSADKLDYIGQKKDATALLFYNASYYDSALARFVSPDTIVLETSTDSDDAN